MEPETEVKFQSEVQNHKHKSGDVVSPQSGMIKVENNDPPISEQLINDELSKISVDNIEEPSNSKQNHESLHTDKKVIIRHQNYNQDQNHQKLKIEFPQNYQEKGYIESIEQIKRILNQKSLNQIKFIRLILRDFSPYVFSQNDKKQKNKKQEDPFESQVSFTSQGQVVEKIQANAPQKQNPSDDRVFIDKEFFNTQWMQKMWDNKLLRNLIMHNPIFHCRIVCVLYLLTSNKKTYNIRFSSELLEVKKKLYANELRYSFDEKVWTQQRQQLSYKYKKGTYSYEDKLPFVLQKLQQDSSFRLIDEFYTKLGFRNKSHPFNKKMAILNQQSYRLRYLKEFSFYSFSNAQQVLKYLDKQDSDRFKNIAFYCNEIKASSRRVKLSQIHDDCCKDYEWLQSCHNYIQWLFPNHFKSQFNESSFPLGYVEAEIFKSDSQMRKKLLRSFEIFIDFMGCSIKEINVTSSTPLGNEQKQKKQKSIIIVSNNNIESFRRLKDCLIYNTHNHLRIMRIIACLLVTGLRKYTEAFLKFLNQLKNRNKDFSCLKYPLQKNWNIYSTSPQNKQRALQMCFIPYQNFPYFQINDDIQGKNKNGKIDFLEDNHGKKRVKMHSSEK